MRRLFLCLALVAFSPIAIADDTEPTTNLDENVVDEGGLSSEIGDDSSTAGCWRFDNQPWQCERAIGCRYQRFSGRCIDDGGGLYPPRNQCWQFNNQPWRCQQAGCDYDRWSRECRPRFDGRQGWQCIAVDAGWEEHWGGHLGWARNQWQAERQAMDECRRFHGRCRISNCQPR